MIFSFTKHPIQYLLDHHFDLFSGVQKLVAIYNDAIDDQLIGVLKTENQKDELNISEFQSEIGKYRKDKGLYSWYDESSLPFRVRQSGVFQQELFDELEKTVLLLRIPNSIDGLNDLIFVYFEKNLSQFSLGLKSQTKLTGELKPLIAKMLYNSVSSVIKDAQLNKETLKSNFNPNTQSIINAHKALKNDYSALQYQFNNTFLKLVKSIFYRYLDKDKYSITINESALAKLIEFNGNYDELESVISNTVDYLSTLYYGNLPEVIAIEDYFIATEAFLEQQTMNQETDRYSKTIALLDNLNEAVKKVIEKNQNPTGINVGQAMQKAISAPAITDVLKNHRSKILVLMDRYPTRWTELKQYFKPIQNISLSSPMRKQIGI